MRGTYPWLAGPLQGVAAQVRDLPLCINRNLGSLPALQPHTHSNPIPSFPEAATTLPLALGLAPFSGYILSKPPVILLPKYDHLKPSFFNFTYTTSPWAFNTAENSIPPWDFTSYYLSTHLPLCCSPPQDRFPLVIVTYPAEITQSQAPLSLEFTLNSSVVDYPHTRADLNGASLAPLRLLNAHWSHYLNWTVNSLRSFTHHTKQDQPTPGTATG